jgi:hypothetical protein
MHMARQIGIGFVACIAKLTALDSWCEPLDRIVPIGSSNVRVAGLESGPSTIIPVHESGPL